MVRATRPQPEVQASLEGFSTELVLGSYEAKFRKRARVRKTHCTSQIVIMAGNSTDAGLNEHMWYGRTTAIGLKFSNNKTAVIIFF